MTGYRVVLTSLTGPKMISTPIRLLHSSVRKYFFNYTSSQIEIYRKYAGHSKWANIKHIKAAKDAQRSELFTRLSRQIRVAIAEGGSSSLEVNPQLARAVEQARKLNMPQTSIQQIIKSADKDLSVPRKQYVMEIKGLGGVMLIVEMICGNLVKTKSEVAVYLRKAQASVSEGVKYLFNKKGVIHATSLKSYPLDKVIENAIEGGADDVSELEEDGKVVFQFYSEPDVLNSLKDYLELRDYHVHFASVEYLPLNVIELNEEHTKLALKLIKNLNDHPDVIAVYDNIS